MIQSIFSPLQSKACLTFEFITRRVLSIQEDPYQALTQAHIDMHMHIFSSQVKLEKMIKFLPNHSFFDLTEN